MFWGPGEVRHLSSEIAVFNKMDDVHKEVSCFLTLGFAISFCSYFWKVENRMRFGSAIWVPKVRSSDPAEVPTEPRRGIKGEVNLSQGEVIYIFVYRIFGYRIFGYRI